MSDNAASEPDFQLTASVSSLGPEPRLEKEDIKLCPSDGDLYDPSIDDASDDKGERVDDEGVSDEDADDCEEGSQVGNPEETPADDLASDTTSTAQVSIQCRTIQAVKASWEKWQEDRYEQEWGIKMSYNDENWVDENYITLDGFWWMVGLWWIVRLRRTPRNEYLAEKVTQFLHFCQRQFDNLKWLFWILVAIAQSLPTAILEHKKLISVWMQEPRQEEPQQEDSEQPLSASDSEQAKTSDSVDVSDSHVDEVVNTESETPVELAPYVPSPISDFTDDELWDAGLNHIGEISAADGEQIIAELHWRGQQLLYFRLQRRSSRTFFQEHFQGGPALIKLTMGELRETFGYYEAEKYRFLSIIRNTHCHPDWSDLSDAAFLYRRIRSLQDYFFDAHFYTDPRVTDTERKIQRILCEQLQILKSKARQTIELLDIAARKSDLHGGKEVVVASTYICNQNEDEDEDEDEITMCMEVVEGVYEDEDSPKWANHFDRFLREVLSWNNYSKHPAFQGAVYMAKKFIEPRKKREIAESRRRAREQRKAEWLAEEERAEEERLREEKEAKERLEKLRLAEAEWCSRSPLHRLARTVDRMAERVWVGAWGV